MMQKVAVQSLGPFALFATLLLAGWSVPAAAQRGRAEQRVRADSAVASSVRTWLVRYGDALMDTSEVSRLPSFESVADSLDWVKWRDRAATTPYPYQIIVSIFDRMLHVVRSGDTLRSATIAVASNTTLEYQGKTWTFRTPRGERRVLRKVTQPVWSPPDWLYAEVASAYGLKLQRLTANSSVRLQYGYRLTVRNGIVGVITPDTREFTPLPVDEHIIFHSTLFIPPFGTHNRRVPGELGPYALDMGNGYLIHGTADQSSIGKAVTHGCIRLADEDITWMYENVPVGTPVLIY
ncbi:MAG: L,D-transpeptidase [Gemmatimonadota bacterium]